MFTWKMLENGWQIWRMKFDQTCPECQRSLAYPSDLKAACSRIWWASWCCYIAQRTGHHTLYAGRKSCSELHTRHSRGGGGGTRLAARRASPRTNRRIRRLCFERQCFWLASKLSAARSAARAVSYYGHCRRGCCA